MEDFSRKHQLKSIIYYVINFKQLSTHLGCDFKHKHYWFNIF